ncbi:kinesin-like protein KIF22 [Babylonia areolata]|uniref:kinesin-like protein KIF22 n=1 Tax=Babylonia areolata TaxID=304850 RepID=UPI003FD4BB0F
MMKGNKETEGKKTGEKRQTRVKVVIRVRPPLVTDSKVCVGTAGNKVEIFNHRNIRENLQYEFSSVYDKTSGQREIFEACVRPLLGHAIKGENVSIFAYGPTGAGKTHTMLGTEGDPGMIPRVIHTLFHKLTSSASSSASTAAKAGAAAAPLQSHKVSFSYLEIYNEKVQDLLNPSETDLPIREDGSHNIFVAGLTEKVINNFDDFKNLFGPASNNRTVAATKLNERSSRSHCIVQLKVETRRSGKVFHGKVYLVDLAGSEDNRRTGNSGLRLKESGAINKSLFVLGEVVDAINNNLPRIPYRNSKLTRLLQDSIGGSCHSVMITNLAPEESFYYDTYCTLNFATKSRKVVNSNVASVTLDRPAEPVSRPLKRSHSVSQVSSGGGGGGGGVSGKRPKLSPAHRSSGPDAHTAAAAAAATTTTTVSPPLVPLVARQEHLERTVKGCMQRMEDLVARINVKSSASSRHHNPSHSKADGAMAEIQRQLQEVRAQLKEIQQQQQRAPVESHTAAAVSQTVPPEQKPERRRSLRKALAAVPSIDSVLKDKTNTENSGRPAAGKARCRAWVSEEPSCSPLFLSPPASRRFDKGFKSTACPKAQGSRNTPLKSRPDAANFSSQQKKQNEEFLLILNSAPVKRLQELHTVGVKRARLIFEWRQTHGHFSSFEELKGIPGFTEKYVHSLLQRNFILTDV